METLVRPTETRVLLNDVSWETYERLLADLQNSSAPRLTFDRGVLEIMSPRQEHEEDNRAIALLVEIVAEARGISIRNLGSTTFKREDLARGFEPDSCFYIRNAARIRGKAPVDLTVDPPPDLVIEIYLTHSSLNKPSIYAQIGVPEVWRYDDGELVILTLADGAYRESEESTVLPGLDRTTMAALMEDSHSLDRIEWLRKVRACAGP
jgi:Uma2 family endonuclease